MRDVLVVDLFEPSQNLLHGLADQTVFDMHPFNARRAFSENPARLNPTLFNPRTRGGFPSVVKNGNTSCTIFDFPPTIACRQTARTDARPRCWK